MKLFNIGFAVVMCGIAYFTISNSAQQIQGTPADDERIFVKLKLNDDQRNFAKKCMKISRAHVIGMDGTKAAAGCSCLSKKTDRKKGKDYQYAQEVVYLSLKITNSKDKNSDALRALADNRKLMSLGENQLNRAIKIATRSFDSCLPS